MRTRPLPMQIVNKEKKKKKMRAWMKCIVKQVWRSKESNRIYCQRRPKDTYFFDMIKKPKKENIKFHGWKKNEVREEGGGLTRSSKDLNIEGWSFYLAVGRHPFVLAPIKEVLALVAYKGPFGERATSVRARC